MDTADLNWEMTRAFLNTLDSMDETFDWRILPKNERPLQLRGTLDDVHTKLSEWNKKGAGIFVVVNTTNGRGQKTENINRVRALFADLDGCPLTNLSTVPLEPHMVIETSPEKYHAYWLVDGLSLDDFKPLQQTIAAICSSDPVVCDLPRIMRVPGFYHHKSEPFMSRIIQHETHATYTADEVKRALLSQVAGRPSSVVEFKQPEFDFNKPLSDGERTNALTHFCGKFMRDGSDDGEILNRLRMWNSRNKPPLPDDKLVSTLHSIRQCDNRGQTETDNIIEEFNRTYAVVPMGGKTVVIREQGHDLDYMSFNSFREWNGNLPKTQGMTAANYWLTHPQRRSYDKIIFNPSTNATNDDSYNLWRGFAVKPHQGNCSLFLEHIRDNIASGDGRLYHYILDWMAEGIQTPHKLPGVALVLRGKQGTGKGVFAVTYGKLFGSHFKHVQNTEHLTGRFTKHLADAAVIFADEVVWGGCKQREGILKALITERQRFVEPKGKDAYKVDNYARIIMATNESWAVPATGEQRRFCVIDVSEACMQDAQYFSNLMNQMEHGGYEALLHFLMTRDISKSDVRNFPKTGALLDQKIRSLESVPHWWHGCLTQGQISEFNDTWEGWVATPELYRAYCEAAHNDRYARGRPRSSSDFISELKKWAPIQLRRPSTNSSDCVRRPRGYDIPSIDICRQTFKEALGQDMEWPDWGNE